MEARQGGDAFGSVYDSPARRGRPPDHPRIIPERTLSICVSIGYTAVMATKDVGLRVRVERGLRDDFLEACRLLDRPAAQVIREFMRSYVAEHGARNRPRRDLRVRTRIRGHVSEP
jgi:hypothetical protein